ncbi:MAG: NapC/NirT family cytochrome c [Thermoanaerobaculia bacterium]
MAPLLTVLAIVAILLVLLIVRKPEITTGPGGKAIAFVAFFLLPGLVTGLGLTRHIEHSKRTEFCLSCHIMEPYGRSLLADDPESLVAAHFQNGRIPRDKACFTCHTSYTMFGDTKAKLKGLKHVYINYIGTVPAKIELYEKYNNRECLHCHAATRSYEENEMHADDLEGLASGETSCLECHSTVHDVENVAGKKLWRETLP